MGKASRKKKQDKPDVATLYAAGTCTRCGEKPRIEAGAGMWCAKCVENARRRRASRPPRIPTRAEALPMLNALIADLEQETPDAHVHAGLQAPEPRT